MTPLIRSIPLALLLFPVQARSQDAPVPRSHRDHPASHAAPRAHARDKRAAPGVAPANGAAAGGVPAPLPKAVAPTRLVLSLSGRLNIAVGQSVDVPLASGSRRPAAPGTPSAAPRAPAGRALLVVGPADPTGGVPPRAEPPTPRVVDGILTATDPTATALSSPGADDAPVRLQLLGVLPPGIRMDSGGALYGTATAPGSYEIRIEASAPGHAPSVSDPLAVVVR